VCFLLAFVLFFNNHCGEEKIDLPHDVSFAVVFLFSTDMIEVEDGF